MFASDISDNADKEFHWKSVAAAATDYSTSTANSDSKYFIAQCGCNTLRG